jgi:hypothetical protein
MFPIFIKADKTNCMKKKIPFTLLALTSILFFFSFAIRQFKPPIPKVWDIEKLRSMHLPYPDSTMNMEPVSEAYYYSLPERLAYKTYPFYMPGKEPKGYYEWLRKQQPEVIFNAADIKTDEDWIKAGEIIYDLPQASTLQIMDSVFMAALPGLETHWKKYVPTAKDGVIPFLSIMVREKGKIELSNFSCGMCHTKLMPDGSLLKGGQGNFQFSTYFASLIRMERDFKKAPDSVMKKRIKFFSRLIFEAPWIKHESQERLKTISVEDWLNSFGTTVGTSHRQSSGLGYPSSIPDLFNLKERKYFDHTGQLLQRDMGDLMRYATLNQNMDRLNDFKGFTAFDKPADPKKSNLSRFSDEQLFALAKYIYSLKPPPNPEKFSPKLLQKGKIIFIEQGCVTCHTPPLYTNNKLTPVDGFEPPASDFKKYGIFNISVGTDPGLSLYTRRGTGYYKIPSLIGAWNRTAFMHNGNLANLEDMFDSKRMEANYVPTGYKPAWLSQMAVPGHPFGMELKPDEKKALVAFIKSL